jgi:hypothetical protein
MTGTSGHHTAVNSTVSERIGGVAKELEAKISERFGKINVKVLIMGPSGTGDRGTAAVLRTELANRCRAFGTSVLPEHPVLQDAASELGPNRDLCTYEHYLADLCQLLLVLPASPGSFCELGFFGMQELICAKMVILFDRDKPRSGTYVSDGPVLAAKQRRAIVEYVDYSDTDGVWAIVKGHIDTVRNSMSLRV